MTLQEWLKREGVTHAQFAARIGVSDRVTVTRYINGRTPHKNVMPRIVVATGGEVTPNDFFRTPVKKEAANAE